MAHWMKCENGWDVAQHSAQNSVDIHRKCYFCSFTPYSIQSFILSEFFLSKGCLFSAYSHCYFLGQEVIKTATCSGLGQARGDGGEGSFGGLGVRLLFVTKKQQWRNPSLCFPPFVGTKVTCARAQHVTKSELESRCLWTLASKQNNCMQTFLLITFSHRFTTLLPCNSKERPNHGAHTKN